MICGGVTSKVCVCVVSCLELLGIDCFIGLCLGGFGFLASFFPVWLHLSKYLEILGLLVMGWLEG